MINLVGIVALGVTAVKYDDWIVAALWSQEQYVVLKCKKMQG